MLKGFTYLFTTASRAGDHVSVVCLLAFSYFFPNLVELLFVLCYSLSYEVTFNSAARIHNIHALNFHLFEIVLGLLIFVRVFMRYHLFLVWVRKHGLELVYALTEVLLV